MKKNWLVYMLKCNDGSIYTGITNNLQKRLQTHKSGKASKYTRSRLPIFLLYTEESENRSTATKRELEIKKMSHKDKFQLFEEQGLLGNYSI